MIVPPASADFLQAYLRRIGFDRPPRPDLATLKALHRAHIEAIPYENLDVQLGLLVTRDPRHAFARMVERRRGGWCYEMNGLFAWMLEAIGFKVARLAGAVLRDTLGEEAIGNHLVLIVDLGEPWLADVGLGNGLFEPVPLAPGPIVQGFKRMALERLDGGWWRFRNPEGMMPPSFDFALDVREEALLEDRCRWLQTDPGSPFVMNAVVQRVFPDRVESLLGKAHTIFSAAGAETRELADALAYETLLRERFGIELPEARSLWARVSSGLQPDLSAA